MMKNPDKSGLDSNSSDKSNMEKHDQSLENDDSPTQASGADSNEKEEMIRDNSSPETDEKNHEVEEETETEVKISKESSERKEIGKKPVSENSVESKTGESVEKKPEELSEEVSIDKEEYKGETPGEDKAENEADKKKAEKPEDEVIEEKDKKEEEKPSSQEKVKEEIKQEKEKRVEVHKKESRKSGIEFIANVRKRVPEGSRDSIASAKFKPGTLKVQKPEDPLFNKRNLIFVGVILVLFVVFIFIFRPRPPASVFNHENFKGAFYPISGGGADDNKAEKQVKGKIKITDKVEGLIEKSCLEFDYENEVNQYIGVGTLKPNLNNFREIIVRIRSKESRTFGLGIEEMSGTDYIYSFPLKSGQWTEISATPGDFMPSHGERDENGKLDLDRLNSRLVIADLSGQKGEIGKNVFWIEKVEIKK